MIGGPMACTLQTPESKLSLTERHENHGRVLSRRVSDLTSSSRFTQVAGVTRLKGETRLEAGTPIGRLLQFSRRGRVRGWAGR